MEKSLKPVARCLAVLAFLSPLGRRGIAADAVVPLPGPARLNAMAARFAPVPLEVSLAGLPETERQALARLVEAARIMDGLFLRQVSAGNESLLVTLAQDSSLLGRARLHYFLINKGPWSRPTS